MITKFSLPKIRPIFVFLITLIVCSSLIAIISIRKKQNSLVIPKQSILVINQPQNLNCALVDSFTIKNNIFVRLFLNKQAMSSVNKVEYFYVPGDANMSNCAGYKFIGAANRTTQYYNFDWSNRKQNVYVWAKVTDNNGFILTGNPLNCPLNDKTIFCGNLSLNLTSIIKTEKITPTIRIFVTPTITPTPVKTLSPTLSPTPGRGGLPTITPIPTFACRKSGSGCLSDEECCPGLTCLLNDYEMYGACGVESSPTTTVLPTPTPTKIPTPTPTRTTTPTRTPTPVPTFACRKSGSGCLSDSECCFGLTCLLNDYEMYGACGVESSPTTTVVSMPTPTRIPPTPTLTPIPTATRTPTPTITPTLTPTPTIDPCPERKLRGDANCDNFTNFEDLDIWSAAYKDVLFGNTSSNLLADFNNDGRIDLLDYSIWRLNANN